MLAVFGGRWSRWWTKHEFEVHVLHLSESHGVTTRHERAVLPANWWAWTSTSRTGHSGSIKQLLLARQGKGQAVDLMKRWASIRRKVVPATRPGQIAKHFGTWATGAKDGEAMAAFAARRETR